MMATMGTPLADGYLARFREAFGQPAPAILLYEHIPAGIGLSEEIFNTYAAIISAALARTRDSPCKDGCPGWVGPAGIEGSGAKAETLAILNILSKDLRGKVG